MKTHSITFSAVALTVAFLLPGASAQGQDHQMIQPSDLKWSDVPSLPPGGKIAVIEGKMSEAQPFTVRISGRPPSSGPTRMLV